MLYLCSKVEVWKKEQLYFSKFLFDIPNNNFKDMIIDHLWKPFWDNIFQTDRVLNKRLDIENPGNKIIYNFYYGKLGNKDKELVLNNDNSAKKRLEMIKKKMSTEEKSANFSKVKESTSTTIFYINNFFFNLLYRTK